MEKYIYINEAMSAIIKNLDHNDADISLSIHKLELEGKIHFKEEGNAVTPIITISSVKGIPIPLDLLYEKIGLVVMNYKVISQAIGGAWWSGYIKN